MQSVKVPRVIYEVQLEGFIVSLPSEYLHEKTTSA